MATSYKALWQEASQEIKRLKEMNRSLSGELDRIRQVVDLAGIAHHMRVERFTPQQWKQRDLLPPVDFPGIREPLWYASTIKESFAIPTGRAWYDNPDQALREIQQAELSSAA